MHPSRNHFLPPDPDAFKQARPSHGRVIVIAPTRAACETIELALHLTDVDTVLEREHGAELREWAAAGQGFGIVAGTGTGKTLGIRPVAETILGESLRVGVVNREREATPETPTWNVVIVTTGIARRWFQDDLIGPQGHGGGGRNPPDLRRAGALPGARQARRRAVHLAQRHGGPGVLRQVPRQQRTCW